MANYVLTNKAVEDLSGIWDYTCETWSVDQAEKYYQLLIDGVEEIAATPRLGRRYDEIANDLLGFHVARHIIFYMLMEKGIKIIRILHEQMDLKQRLRD